MSIEHYIAGFDFPINSNYLINSLMDTDSYWVASSSVGSLSYSTGVYYSGPRSLNFYLASSAAQPPLNTQIDLDNIGYGTSFLTASHPWALNGNYVLCNPTSHMFIVLSGFTETVLYTFTVPAVTSGGLLAISGWGINPSDGHLFVCCKSQSGLNYYRRDLIYSGPGCTNILDQQYQVLIGIDAYPVHGKNYYFESSSGGRIWETFLTFAEGFTGFPGGIREINTDFDSIGPYGYKNFRFYKSSSSSDYVDVRDIYFSCDGTYFYTSITVDLGSGTGDKIIRLNPSKIYIYTGTAEGSWRVAIPYGDYNVIRSSGVTLFTMPNQWTNGSIIPNSVYSQSIGYSPTGGNTIQLYTDPTTQIIYTG